LCHKTQPLKIRNLWMKTAKGASHSCYRGVADLIQFTAERLGRVLEKLTSIERRPLSFADVLLSWIAHVNDNMTVFTSPTAYALSIRDTRADSLINLSATLLSRQDQLLVYAAHVHLVLQLDHRRTGVMPVDAVPTRALHGRQKRGFQQGMDVVHRINLDGGGLCPGHLQLLQSGRQGFDHILA